MWCHSVAGEQGSGLAHPEIQSLTTLCPSAKLTPSPTKNAWAQIASIPSLNLSFLKYPWYTRPRHTVNDNAMMTYVRTGAVLYYRICSEMSIPLCHKMRDTVRRLLHLVV